MVRQGGRNFLLSEFVLVSKVIVACRMCSYYFVILVSTGVGSAFVKVVRNNIGV